MARQAFARRLAAQTRLRFGTQARAGALGPQLHDQFVALASKREAGCAAGGQGGGAQLRAQLRAHLRIVPFLSGDNFDAAVAAECLEKGIGTVRPSGEGFIVKAAELTA